MKQKPPITADDVNAAFAEMVNRCEDYARQVAYEEILMSEMTEIQLARVGERWELLCEQRGWPVAD